MQWNLLAYGLSAENPSVKGGNQGWLACQEGALKWPDRRHRLCEEILQRRPRIICCQGKSIVKPVPFH